jgi:hypothetical protein
MKHGGIQVFPVGAMILIKPGAEIPGSEEAACLKHVHLVLFRAAVLLILAGK